uniref:Uncharacterized protein n=1 Tax=viral metagenome TaxID=1070528 RepID=A0A6M3JM34_9ZZZZ
MPNIKIGFDLDGVVLDTPTEILKEVEKRTGIKTNIEDVYSHSIEEVYKLDPYLADDIVRSVLSRDYIPSIDQAVPFINALHVVFGADIYFISNKRKELYEHDYNLLQKLGIYSPFKLILVQKDDAGVPAKANIIKEKNIKLFVEDRLDTIIDILQNTICNVVVMDKPWNRKLEVHPMLIRIKTWYELYFIIARFLSTGLFKK